MFSMISKEFSKNIKFNEWTFRPVAAATSDHCQQRFPAEPDVNGDDGAAVVDRPLPHSRFQRTAW
jgi:hypothetical protein